MTLPSRRRTVVAPSPAAPPDPPPACAQFDQAEPLTAVPGTPGPTPGRWPAAPEPSGRLSTAAELTPLAGVEPAALADPLRFSQRVRQGFGRGAASYESQARLQQAVAWRLAHLCRDLPLLEGPRADLGAGSGLLSRALLAQGGLAAEQPPQQIDLCPELLGRNPLAGPAPRPWDLNRGLPPQLEGAALLASSFALQWLDDPITQLAGWIRHLAPGGWLALALPVAGSFPAWMAAARAAAVPCSALDLPEAGGLIAAAEAAGLQLRHCRQLRFSQADADGLATLRLLRALGATASRQPPLRPGQLRRLLAHWPPLPLRWEVLLLVGHRPWAAAPPVSAGANGGLS